MTAAVYATPARGARNGLPERVNYTYRGTGADTLTPWMDDGCYCTGNNRAYEVHLQQREEPCGRSRAAHAAKNRAAAERKRAQP